jgi:predicted nucleic acid-binding protein
VPEIFADTFYWIALANPADSSHRAAGAFDLANSEATLVTTDEVLSEFLNYFASAGERKRSIVVGMFEEAMKHAAIEVVPQTRQSLLRGLDLYKARSDKSYSLTDCVSMMTMRERNITDVLTHDRHFAQEGFRLLL